VKLYKVVLSILIFVLSPQSLLFCQPAGSVTDEQKQGTGMTKESLDLINANYKRAMECYIKGDCAEAIRCWEDILKLDPGQVPPQKMIPLARERLKKSLETLRQRGVDAFSQGKYSLAVDCYVEYLRYDPTDSEMTTGLKKLRAIKEIIPDATDSNKAFRMVRIGVINYMYPNGDIALAIDALRYATQLDKVNQPIAKLRAHLESEHPKIVKLTPFNPAKGLVEQRLDAALNNIYEGNYDSAIVNCEEVLELDPGNVVAYTRIGSSYFALGKKDKAKLAWQEVLRLDPNNKDVRKFINQIK